MGYDNPTFSQKKRHGRDWLVIAGKRKSNNIEQREVDRPKNTSNNIVS
jgi:hypothetical protein